ncbi:MAG: hypothetical protein ACPGTU_15945, partial [Myxococcota bacterium]
MVAVIYLCLVGLTAVERLVELVVGKRNTAWSLSQGGIEYGQGHWPWMVTLHTLFLVSCAAEVVLLNTVFSPIIGSIMLIVALGCQA